jgi:hypothetical protein
MTPRFEKAYNALVKGFFEGTLAKGTCAACAVGNIVADAQGGVISKIKEPIHPHCSTKNDFWRHLFCSDAGSQDKRWSKLSNSQYNKLATRLKKLTGYSEAEMAHIEFTFETNTRIHHYDYYMRDEQDILEDQYRGLSAVVNVMLKLDSIEPDPKYAAKFREHKSLQPA